ncbi:MAG: hypothetical protein WAQ33_02010 [Gaiellaceae bacterium]
MLVAAFVVAALVAAPVSAASTPTQLAFAVCPNVTQPIYPGPAPGPGDLQHVTSQLGCAPPVTSANFVDPVGCTGHTNTDLGIFRLGQNPFGVAVQISTQASCPPDPPNLGAGIGNGAFSVSVARAGFCPSTVTIPGRTGNASVVLPIGNLSFGKYTVTVDFPAQGDWSGIRASGTLRVGDTTFTETDTIALARGNTFAVLLNNSLAGQGAGQLVSKVGNRFINLSGTDYYACGTINVAATLKTGKRGANGVARLSGDGSINGGTGNYKGLRGSFTVTGSLSTRTSRGTLVLKGSATY